MKKAIVLGMGICASILIGCGAETVLNETITIQETATEQESVVETVVSEQISASEDSDTSVAINLEDVTAEQLKQVTTSIETIQQNSDWEAMDKMDFVVIDSAEEDVVLYGRGTAEGMILRVKDEVCPIREAWLAPLICIPELHVQDLDGNGEIEYIIKTHVKTGTGVAGEDLYVVTHRDGTFAVQEFMEEDWFEQLMSRLSWKYDEEYSTVELSVDGTYSGVTLFLGKFLEENQVSFKDLCFGDVMGFVCRDEKWYLWMEGGIFVEGWVTPQYECGVNILAPISYSEDGTFTLGEIQVMEKESDSIYSDAEEENVIPECVQNVVYADVTHDGVKDCIVTSITDNSGTEVEKTAQQLLNQAEVCYIRVYDGNYLSSIYDTEKFTKTDGYDTRLAIWEKELSNAHVGNGQVFLYEESDRGYLLESVDYIGQGTANFNYRMLSLDEEGRIFVTKKNAYSFSEMESSLERYPEYVYDEEKMKAYTDDFGALLEKAVLLVATDVWKDPRVTTKENVCTYEISEVWEKSESLREEGASAVH